MLTTFPNNNIKTVQVFAQIVRLHTSTCGQYTFVHRPLQHNDKLVFVYHCVYHGRTILLWCTRIRHPSHHSNTALSLVIIMSYIRRYVRASDVRPSQMTLTPDQTTLVDCSNLDIGGPK